MARVLIVGGCGYIGCRAVMALQDDHDVTVFDKGLFSPGVSFVREQEVAGRCRLLLGDLRSLSPGLLDDMDAVIHLAGLSNDPTADFSPELNWALNVTATQSLVDAAVQAQVSRFIFASSCSVYGFSHQMGLTEDSPVSPQSAYAESKLAAESIVLEHREICPIVLRQGTVGGWSPRMRWDLIVNTMTMTGVRDGVVRVFGLGDAMRPLIDVGDLVSVYRAMLDYPDPESLRGQIFNVAASRQEGLAGCEGYSSGMVGALVAGALAKEGYPVTLEHKLDGVETRSYDVSCAKLKSLLGWVPTTGVAETVADISGELDAGELVGFNDPRAKNIDWMIAMAEAEEICARDGRIW